MCRSKLIFPDLSTSAHSCCLPLPTMAIGLLAPFTRLVPKRDCQHDPCCVGDFLRVGLALRAAKRIKSR
jgi:hypothetical protein